MDIVAMLENKDGKDKDIVWHVRRVREAGKEGEEFFGDILLFGIKNSNRRNRMRWLVGITDSVAMS